MTRLADRLQVPHTAPFPGSHLGLRWRSFRASDAAEVADLIREVEAADEAIHRSTVSTVADMMEGARGADLVDSVVGVDAEAHIVAVASVRVLGDVTEAAIAIVNAVIAPHWRGRGLGRALLYWQDARARQLLVARFGADCELPASVMNIVDAHMTDRRRLYIAAGFYARRTFMTMYRELEGGEVVPPVRAGQCIVPLAEVPLAKVGALHEEVFRDHFLPPMRMRWWQEAVDELDHRWSFVALDEAGEPAGYCIGTRPVLRWVATGRQEAYISLLGVRGDQRGRGLTSALIGRAVAEASRLGMGRIGLDVDIDNPHGAHAMYEHLGFVDDRAEVFYTVDL